MEAADELRLLLLFSACCEFQCPVAWEYTQPYILQELIHSKQGHNYFRQPINYYLSL
jgi:hypothetical protein